VDQPAPTNCNDGRASRSVFVSYATTNRAEALKVCNAIERHGVHCWISLRDVPPGQNYQEEIVKALRNARALVLVFSDAANSSDEIKKELSLASRYHIPVMALRIQDVEPSDAFAYELSTRQWVDAFDGWDQAIDCLVQEISQTPPSPTGGRAKDDQPLASGRPQRTVTPASALALLLVAAGGAWWLLRPSAETPHPMTIRLAGFSRLSEDLPSTMPDAIRDEITAAFANDGTIGVSTATSAPPGTAPAYALSGTVRHDGDKIKVIARLINERSSANLWSESLVFDAKEASSVPRKVAVIAGTMVRCGLFGASTYPKALPDTVMADYLQFCRYDGQVSFEPTRAMDFAQKVVAAAPDFSWGWSAIAESATLANSGWSSNPEAQSLRATGLEAADKALELDHTNSQALGNKSQLIDRSKLVEREQLLKRALAARPQSCGCEHFIYGAMLSEVGRFSDAAVQMRRSIELNPMDQFGQWSFGDLLLAAGNGADAKPHLAAAIDVSNNPDIANNVTVGEALLTGDLQGALKVLRDPGSNYPPAEKAALIAGFEAVRAKDTAAKAEAIRLLTSMKFGNDGSVASSLLGALGANVQALKIVSDEAADNSWAARSWLFYPTMRSALSDPSFPALAQKLGLIRYWRATKRKPDVCLASQAPPFCRMI